MTIYLLVTFLLGIKTAPTAEMFFTVAGVCGAIDRRNAEGDGNAEIYRVRTDTLIVERVVCEITPMKVVPIHPEGIKLDFKTPSWIPVNGDFKTKPDAGDK